MKKNIVVVLSSIFLWTCVTLPVYAADFPVKEISGVIKEVKMKTPESVSARGYTILDFKDGRVVAFDGIYVGLVFERDKECKVTYQYSNASFAQGTYIKKIECK